MSALTIDPARFEVVKNALYCAAEEMKIVLAKTAYSPLLKVAGDYSCGIFDAHGNMVAQGPDLPIHLGSMPDAVRAIVQAFPDAAPGDVFIHNDPYQGGSHLPDVNVVAPAFHNDSLLGFGCVRAHWPDVGSATPGSYGAVTEIFGEGLRLPPVRLYRNHRPDPNMEAVIFANVRTPSERMGDLRAQVAANWRAAVRLSALATKYGTQALLDIMQEVQNYSERMMRAALRALPDGSAEFTDVFDGDGIIAPSESADETFIVKVRINKRGDAVVADFTGSDPAVAGPMNAPLTVTASGVFCALKMIVDPKNLIPPNSGCWRAVTVTAPPGSVVNAQPPSPVVYANHEMSHRIADMVMGAMFQITPHTVMAANAMSATNR
jgi:N-methylhydantoinase B